MSRLYHAINIIILLSVRRNLIEMLFQIRNLIRKNLMYHSIQYCASVKRIAEKDIYLLLDQPLHVYIKVISALDTLGATGTT